MVVVVVVVGGGVISLFLFGVSGSCRDPLGVDLMDLRSVAVEEWLKVTGRWR